MVVKSGVEVVRGRSASVTEKELRISVEPAADCKVEVVQNEPATQRVGRLTPQVRAHTCQWQFIRLDVSVRPAQRRHHVFAAGVRLQLPRGRGEVRPQRQPPAGRGLSDAQGLQVSQATQHLIIIILNFLFPHLATIDELRHSIFASSGKVSLNIAL